MNEQQKRVEFTPPKDFKLPEGTGTDKEWDMVCSFKTKASGEICMTRLGDTPMPGYEEGRDHHDEDRESEHKPGYDRMSNGIMSRIGSSGGGSGGGMGGY